MAKDTNNLCPIMMLAKNTGSTKETRDNSSRCRGARCQWWNETESKCAILVIAEK